MAMRKTAPVTRFDFCNPKLCISQMSQKWASVEIWVKHPGRSSDLVRWEVNGLCFYRIPINESHLRSARRWSRKLDLFELKLANDFMKRRGLDWTHAFGTRVPPLAWIQDELRYWMPAQVRYRLPAVGMRSL